MGTARSEAKIASFANGDMGESSWRALGQADDCPQTMILRGG
jgi:hypothetical protein